MIAESSPPPHPGHFHCGYPEGGAAARHRACSRGTCSGSGADYPFSMAAILSGLDLSNVGGRTGECWLQAVKLRV
jgi:hypothetical protein